MARSCLSSLMNISDLSTLLRLATLTRLSLGATCLLSAKTSDDQNYGQYNEITIRSERNTKNEGVVKSQGYYPRFREKMT